MFSKQRNLETLQDRLGFCVQELGQCDTHLEVVIGYLWCRQEDHPAIVLASVNQALKEVLQVIEQELLALTERGGEVTYHGPGQWVGYPILNLRRHQTDLHWYLRQLEQVVIDVLAALDLQGERISGLTGVWLRGAKVAAVGIRVRRWISFHGFSLNVCPDLENYRNIVPCGIADRPVGSLAQFRPDLTLDQVQPLIVEAFCRRFLVRPRRIAIEHWLVDPADGDGIASEASSRISKSRSRSRFVLQASTFVFE